MESLSNWRCGTSSSTSGYEYKLDGIMKRHNMVLDSARGELVEAPAKLEASKTASSSERSLEALKNHSEAEKRRRARINAHFDTLRTLIPGAKKMDKASLLGEVISHLKDLSQKAAKASEDCFIPNYMDEVKVEQEDNQSLEGRPNRVIRVSLSCNYRPGLLSDLRQALEALHLIATRAEIATLGSRMKNVFVMTVPREENKFSGQGLHMRSVCEAVRSVIDNASPSDELLEANKRRRVSMFGL